MKSDAIKVVERRSNPSAITEFDRQRYRFAASFVKGKTVLDAACGIGYGTAILMDAGAQRVLGIDNDPASIETAKRLFARDSVSFECMSCFEISGKYDVIVSLETIEHLDDGELWASHVASVMEPEGIAVISTRLRQHGTLEDPPDNPHHVREWRPHEFGELLGSEFGRVTVHYQGFAPPAVGGIAPLRPFRRGLILRRLATDGPPEVLSIDDWFGQYECKPLYMVAVCAAPLSTGR